MTTTWGVGTHSCYAASDAALGLVARRCGRCAVRARGARARARSCGSSARTQRPSGRRGMCSVHAERSHRRTATASAPERRRAPSTVVDYRSTRSASLRVDERRPPRADACPQVQPHVDRARQRSSRGDLTSTRCRVAPAVSTSTVDPRARAHADRQVDRVPGDRPSRSRRRSIAASTRNGDRSPISQFMLFACDDPNGPSPARTRDSALEVWYWPRPARASRRHRAPIACSQSCGLRDGSPRRCSPPNAARCTRKPRRGSRWSIRARIARRCRRSAISRSTARCTRMPGVAADRAMLPEPDPTPTRLRDARDRAAGRQLSDARVLGRVRARDRRA